MHLVRFALVTLLASTTLLALPSCSQIQVHSVYDRGVDFSAFKTWAWATNDPLLVNDGTGNPRVYNDANDRLIREAVGRELRARGLEMKQPDEDADLVLYFTVITEKMIEVGGVGQNPYGLQWSEDIARAQREKGTLTLGIFDRTSRKQVWSGWASKPLTPGEDPKAVIDAAVAKILESFPPA